MSKMLEPGEPPERVTEQDWALGKDWRGTGGAAPERLVPGLGPRLPVPAWGPQWWVITASDLWKLEIGRAPGEPESALA